MVLASKFDPYYFRIVEQVHKLVNQHRRQRGLPRWDWKNRRPLGHKWNPTIQLIMGLKVGEETKIKLASNATLKQLRSILYLRKETMHFRWSIVSAQGEERLLRVKKTGTF